MPFNNIRFPCSHECYIQQNFFLLQSFFVNPKRIVLRTLSNKCVFRCRVCLTGRDYTVLNGLAIICDKILHQKRVKTTE